MRIVERLSSIPNDSKCRCDVGRFRDVHEFHRVAVNCVTKELSIHTGNSPFDVELTHISGLDDGMPNHVDTNFN